MYSPAWLQSLDEIRYSRVWPPEIFGDYWMPAGYALFTQSMQAIYPELWAAISIQHLIGMSVGVSLFLALRRLGVTAWLACFPAGVAFLTGDLIWLEHQIVAETFMTAAIALGLASVVRGLVPTVSYPWLVVGSLFLLYAGLSRSIALAILPVVAVIAVVWVRQGLGIRARVAGALVIPALLLLGSYLLAFQVSGGQYLGLGDMSGWNLYSRVATFADCRQFDPPSGTAQLCEQTAESERSGGLGYWDPNSHARVVLGVDATNWPETDSLVGGFAKQVIVNQPLAYLKAVGTDALRYIDPEFGPDRPYSGTSHEAQSFGLVDPSTKEYIEAELAKKWRGTHVTVVGRDFLADYQNVFRLNGPALVVLLFLSVVGAILGRGTLRLGIFLYGSTALLLYLIPVAVLSWEVRYGMPPQPFLAAAGALGLAVVLSRFHLIVPGPRSF